MSKQQVARVPAGQASRRINWSPYLSGVGIGVLSWIAFAVAHDPLGVTTPFSRVASLFAIPLIGAQHVARNSYWKAMPLRFDYGVALLVGLMLGAFVSAWASGGLRLEMVPRNWSRRFGDSLTRRFIASFLGGLILMYGARLAGGCTSGHAISGGLQLALSSWVFLIVIFASGILVSAVVFGVRKEYRQ